MNFLWILLSLFQSVATEADLFSKPRTILGYVDTIQYVYGAYFGSSCYLFPQSACWGELIFQYDNQGPSVNKQFRFDYYSTSLNLDWKFMGTNFDISSSGTTKGLISYVSGGTTVDSWNSNVVPIYPNLAIIFLNTYSQKNYFILKAAYRYYCDTRAGKSCSKVCYMENTNYECDPITGLIVCHPGYYGSSCTSISNPCLNNPCLNGGKCEIYEYFNYRCICNSNFQGTNCETSKCTPANCFNGICVNSISCLCINGFSGASCQNRDCYDGYCKNGGICQNQGIMAKPICLCGSKFAGSRCEYECKYNCMNNGKCGLLQTTEAICFCTPEYNGPDCLTPKSSAPLPCQVGLGCLNGGTCTNIQQSYFCNCLPGWYGASCENDICLQKKCYKGTCLQSVGCICEEGYTGEKCEIVDCGSYNKCQQGSTCIENVVPECQCKNDQTGEFCQDSCKTTCVNGYCSNVNGLIQCLCNKGYYGPSCDIFQNNLTVCSFNPCLNGGMCSPISETTFKCKCSQFWKNEICSEPSCNISNCVNGVCVNGLGCKCVENYQGNKCEQPICNATIKCNSGKRTTFMGYPKCECNPQTSTGEYCEFVCSPTCSVNGICQLVDSKPSCVCFAGHYGVSCDEIHEFYLSYITLIILIIVSVIFFIIGVIFCVILYLKQKKFKYMALQNAMFDPSKILNLPINSGKNTDIHDTYTID